MNPDAPVPASDDRETPELTDAQRALRAQLLATEHWSLLASRSTTQSEVLTRIAIFLTMVSAGLFGLGILGNATRFSGWFGVAALGVLALLALLGVITQLRVMNAGFDDLSYVLAMNRLRGAYLDLDPGVERYLVASPFDDEAGAGRTYYPFRGRALTHVVASSMMVIVVVEAALLALLVGSMALALVGSVAPAVGLGAVVLAAWVVLSAVTGQRTYAGVWSQHVPLRRSPPHDRRGAASG